MLQVGENIQPEVDEIAIAPLVSRLYGIVFTTCTRLNSYDDLNYHIQTGAESPSTSYVLKIMNTAHKLSDVRAQTNLMLHVSGQGLAVPTPVRNMNGDYWSAEPLKSVNGSVTVYVVRLLTYIPGKLLGSSPVTKSLLYQAGCYLARFHCSAKGYMDGNLDRENHIWTLPNIPELSKFVFAVADTESRALAKSIIDAWHVVEANYPHMTRGVLHGDPNEMNIIVTPEIPHRICGLIDYGDAHNGYLVFDVAMLIAYMLMYTDVDLLDAGGYVLAGYLSHNDGVNKNELDVLYNAVLGRLVQSVVLGLYTFSMTANQYVLNTQVPGWKVLRELSSIGKDRTLSHWLAIVAEVQGDELALQN